MESISRVFQESFESVSGVFYGCLRQDVSKKFQVFYYSFMGASGKFQGCIKSVSRVIKESFKRPFKQVSRASFKRVSSIFHKTFKEFSTTKISRGFNRSLKLL